MTERMSIEEFRLLRESGKAKLPSSAKKCIGCEHAAALLKMLERMLKLGYQVRLEHRFHNSRRWRFDVALLGCKVAIEIDGYGPGHYGITGREQDNEKDAAAQALGWRVLRVGWKHIKNGEALAAVERLVGVSHG